MARNSPEVATRIGIALRATRRSLGLTQQQLALRVGIAPNYLALLERGERAASLSLVGRLAVVLGVDVSDLFDEDPIEESDNEDLALSLFRMLSESEQLQAIALLRVLATPEAPPQARKARGTARAKSAKKRVDKRR